MSGNLKEYLIPNIERCYVIIKELLARTFVKVYSTENLSNDEKRGRERTIVRNKEALQDENEYRSTINVVFYICKPGKDPRNVWMDLKKFNR